MSNPTEHAPYEEIEEAWHDQVFTYWHEALLQAWQLARGERLGELRAKRSKRFDDRGLHPYSYCWGKIMACEELLPELAGARLSDPMCDPVTLRRWAERDAQESFRSELLAEGWPV